MTEPHVSSPINEKSQDVLVCRTDWSHNFVKATCFIEVKTCHCHERLFPLKIKIPKLQIIERKMNLLNFEA